MKRDVVFNVRRRYDKCFSSSTHLSYSIVFKSNFLLRKRPQFIAFGRRRRCGIINGIPKRSASLNQSYNIVFAVDFI